MSTKYDNIYYISGGKFPYRRYIHGSSHVVEKLSHLINDYEPIYDFNGFNQRIIERKVKSRMKNKTVFDFFSKGPKGVEQQNDWEYDSVVDFYTETARMSSIGYGKKMSPLQFWEYNVYNGERKRIFQSTKTLKEARDAIYNEFKNNEVRLAYVTDSIGLLNRLKEHLNSNDNKMLDITAFGDRLIAAASTNFDYTGIDPDPNLVDGINRLILDVKTINPYFQCQTFTVPMEHYTPSTEFDLITLSPPPFNMELYDGGERQTHRVYRDFSHWFYGFIGETLSRASLWVREGGILAFSVLDREGPFNIQYTEPMILLAMSFGFKPLEIYTLRSSAGTPWWVFRKDSSYYDDSVKTYYPELVMNPSIFKNNNPAMEYIRLLAQRYLVSYLQRILFFRRHEKTKDIIARMFMSKTPTPYEPDLLFMDNESDFIINEEDFNPDWRRDPIIIQTSDQGYRTVVYPEEKTMEEILRMVFTSISNYLQWIQCTNAYEQFEKKVKVSMINARFGRFVNLYVNHSDILGVVHFIRSQTLFEEKELDKIKILPKCMVLWSTKDPLANTNNISSFLRYNAVDTMGHHFTRPESRIEAIKAIAKDDKIVDLFSTPSNANTKYYTSPYPDVDPGSLGNFFTYEGDNFDTFMANPPSYKKFDEKVYNKLIKTYISKSKKLFYSIPVWEDNAMKYIDLIKAGENPEFDDLENYYLPTMLSKEKSLVAIYILSYDKHPSYDPINKKIMPKRKVESVGFIFGNKKDFDLSKLDMLSDGAHYIVDE